MLPVSEDEDTSASKLRATETCACALRSYPARYNLPSATDSGSALYSTANVLHPTYLRWKSSLQLLDARLAWIRGLQRSTRLTECNVARQGLALSSQRWGKHLELWSRRFGAPLGRYVFGTRRKISCRSCESSETAR